MVISIVNDETTVTAYMTPPEARNIGVGMKYAIAGSGEFYGRENVKIDDGVLTVCDGIHFDCVILDREIDRFWLSSMLVTFAGRAESG